MLIIGCDYHPSFQQIAFVDSETGECGERKLTHKQEAESFYRGLNGGRVRIGMGGDGACALVRTTAGRVELRVVDRRSRRDPRQAGTEAEERPSGCRTFV